MAQGELFDVVCSFEVIEHVADPAEFVDSCAALAKDGAAVFLSTMSRTELAYAVAIVAAEQVLQEVSSLPLSSLPPAVVNVPCVCLAVQ